MPKIALPRAKRNSSPKVPRPSKRGRSSTLQHLGKTWDLSDFVKSLEIVKPTGGWGLSPISLAAVNAKHIWTYLKTCRSWLPFPRRVAGKDGHGEDEGWAVALGVRVGADAELKVENTKGSSEGKRDSLKCLLLNFAGADQYYKQKIESNLPFSL